MDKKGLFRDKSIERISSPEQLNDYLRVVTPAVWTTMGAIIVLLIGIITWGVFGKLEAFKPIVVEVKDGIVSGYVLDADSRELEAGMEVDFDGLTGKITNINPSPVYSEDIDDYYLLHVLGLDNNDAWIKIVGIATEDDVEEGSFEGKVIIERITPSFFVIN